MSLVWTCETCNRSTQNELPDASTPHEKSPERSSTCSLEPCQPLREPALRGLHVPVEKGRNTDPLFKEEEENQKKQTSPSLQLAPPPEALPVTIEQDFGRLPPHVLLSLPEPQIRAAVGRARLRVDSHN